MTRCLWGLVREEKLGPCLQPGAQVWARNSGDYCVSRPGVALALMSEF
jgi:hypothetical protein